MAKKHKEGLKLRVVDGGNASVIQEILSVYDATIHVGLHTMICNAAIRRVEDGEETIEIPNVEELRAAAAVWRCLQPFKLRGPELKAIRKILGWTVAEMAKRLDDRTAPETVSRWEDRQPMGGYAEKMLRLLVCEELTARAPGVQYHAKKIAELRVLDPWAVQPDYELPALSFSRVPMKQVSGDIVDVWDQKVACAGGM